jgi:hypothetical protein
VQACGNSTSGNGPSETSALCNQGCDKAGTCFADTGALGESFVASCKQQCGSASNQQCANQAAIMGKAQECFAIADCGGYLQCLQSVPKCEGGSAGSTATGSGGSAGSNVTTGFTTTTDGAGGSTGSSGSTGSGGTGSSASCDACAKADACCIALGGTAGQCNSGESCSGETGQTRDAIIMECMALLRAAASSSSAPAACK